MRKEAGKDAARHDGLRLAEGACKVGYGIGRLQPSRSASSCSTSLMRPAQMIMEGHMQDCWPPPQISCALASVSCNICCAQSHACACDLHEAQTSETRSACTAAAFARHGHPSKAEATKHLVWVEADDQGALLQHRPVGAAMPQVGPKLHQNLIRQ